MQHFWSDGRPSWWSVDPCCICWDFSRVKASGNLVETTTAEFCLKPNLETLNQIGGLPLLSVPLRYTGCCDRLRPHCPNLKCSVYVTSQSQCLASNPVTVSWPRVKITVPLSIFSPLMLSSYLWCSHQASMDRTTGWNKGGKQHRRLFKPVGEKVGSILFKWMQMF